MSEPSIEPQETVLTPDDIKSLLSRDRNRYWHQLHADLIERICRDYRDWPAAETLEVDSAGGERMKKSRILVLFLRYEISHVADNLAQLKNRFGEYTKRYTKAVGDKEKKQQILNYAKELGATPKQLRGDEKAFERWFGHDTVSDRFQRRYLETERFLSFALQCLGYTAAQVLQDIPDASGALALWRLLQVETTLRPLLDYHGDNRVLASAFEALSKSVRAMPEPLQAVCITDSTRRFILHSCYGNQSVWVQCEALQLLQAVSPASLKIFLRNRFDFPKDNDDLFVRRKAVQIIVEQLDRTPDLEDILVLAMQDSAPSVRQKLADLLPRTGLDVKKRFYPVLLFGDKSAPVRAAALLSLLALLTGEEEFELALVYLGEVLQTEKERFVLRTVLHVCRAGLDRLIEADMPAARQAFYVQSLLPAINTLHQTCSFLAVRRYAAQTKEYLLVYSDLERRQRMERLKQFVENIPPGATRRMPKSLADADDDELGRLLSVIAQKDFGFDVEKTVVGRFLTRGHAFGFRLWRVLHEFRHPSPDKRQAFRHTVGRLFWGELRVPSAILSELAETKIPGEPLFMDTEDGWRGYLPLVDEVISALSLGRNPTYFYHSEGVVTLIPPRAWLQRRLASWKLTVNFAAYAHLRNWQEKGQSPPQSYLNALAALGIRVTYSGHRSPRPEQRSIDPAVSRFFPAVLPEWLGIGSSGSLWLEFKDYFISAYGNSLIELAAFLTLALSYFMGRHIYLYRTFRKARKRLPLVLGGWGTRGKSGTERIKAAMMNALGFSIVSKTTGCEAMFLHAHPFGTLREMFLFRPYDKATIWEQHNLVCLAAKLHCEVFLWECMGLTPSYVDILQRQWMRDDVSTITNTYPDHEDIQGPAGINIPQVMTNFIPQNGTLMTTEEQMRPILQSAAQAKHTAFNPVGWLEAGLLAEDVLARFPYDEHPFNIALVLAMGAELGIEHDFAIKEMADRVVADIGVLKTYPPAPWKSRRLEFVNGMSANERFGCLSNWVRCGFDKLSIENNPDKWITIVVNNRADRIARSRVFASIVVKDLSFDRCVLIGNNLTGLVSYIKESWAEWIDTVTLKSDKETPQAILLRLAQQFRVPYTSEILKQRLAVMAKAQNQPVDLEEMYQHIDQPEKILTYLQGVNLPHADEIVFFLTQGLGLLAEYRDFSTQLSQSDAPVSEALEKKFHELLWRWFELKLVVVEDYYATGNQVIEFIGHATPPGFYNKIMGIQNIKGTGLDFVYRWQAWDNCYKYCQQLSNTNPAISASGLRALAAFQEHGVLTEEAVKETIAKVENLPIAHSELYQADLSIIKANLARAVESLAQKGGQKASGNSWIKKATAALEAFLDAGDAVKRRKKANQIYKDLVSERISHERATLELQKINKRQKGGWLHVTLPHKTGDSH